MDGGATADLMYGYHELCAARPAYHRAREFYNGTAGEVFASPQVKKLLARAGVENIEELNFAKIPVNTVANRLKLQSISVADDTATDADDAEVTGAQAALDWLWRVNEMDDEAPAFNRNVCRDGDGYLFVWPVQDEQGKTIGVDIRVNEAHTARVIYDPEDQLRVAYAIKSWSYEADGKEYTRANLYYPSDGEGGPGRVERWITKPGTDGSKHDQWESYNPDGRGDDNLPGAPIPNPYDEQTVPFFHARTDRPYGVPLHADAYGPQQLINKLVTAHAATIDFSSFPQRYALMDPAIDDPHSNRTDPFHPEDDDEDPEDSAGTSGMTADPSSVWKLWARSVGQFAVADPEIFLRPFDRYIRAMAQLTETPLYHFGTATGETPSGAALRTIDAPTADKVGDMHRRIGGVYSGASEFALRLLGFADPVVSVTWKPAQPVTDQEGWQTVGLKISNGVPVKQALTEAGYLPEQVDGWLESDDGSDLTRRLELLQSLAGVIQQLGVGVGLGVVDQEIVDQLVGGVLEALVPAQETPTK